MESLMFFGVLIVVAVLVGSFFARLLEWEPDEGGYRPDLDAKKKGFDHSENHTFDHSSHWHHHHHDHSQNF
ncbi:hypothetical protein JQ557_05875 [Bradyrhizobium sp. U87765 SZCCT0131]|uniref:hypothetical protein n=1 Tax=unclassified Bradyrhizobium TaxID=2631580 RepID=UPI001BAB2C21|nr:MULTISPECIES: hypothetical protein [unclassified Bradyrhizobium]MBR1217505.1 hypothetical protein [Bradyrhizobium sp. U87765 SZCCT0131]MBR1264897.1 hypothetical protein [Bradyrhizobium sp. U87765 SZCCT0134]MBR1304879.1 hypothetical protein [Bradyrhizobium sp. U87765 SZCCT0110]MBR1320666.1 hypothetical protein [Bradyrhizobium sp. U87765 SZCCT0109]MBR1349086.1 hypothetical protein [Bradyrhizobium sp. U87765 SZCCT0048]